MEEFLGEALRVREKTTGSPDEDYGGGGD